MMKWNAVPFVLALGLFAAVPAQAQVGFGVQGSYGTEVEGFGIGVRAVTPIGHMVTQDSESMMAGLRLIGSFDYFFPDCGDGDGVDCSYMELNANGAVPVPLEGGLAPYVGAGLNIARAAFEVESLDIDESDTEIGINLLGGIDFPMGGLNTFAEGRLELGGGEQFVITLGVLF